jgi:hypothetical protein
MYPFLGQMVYQGRATIKNKKLAEAKGPTFHFANLIEFPFNQVPFSAEE